ncbi:MAG: BMP family protein [Candidatus Eremiobacterota bacterium]
MKRYTCILLLFLSVIFSSCQKTTTGETPVPSAEPTVISEATPAAEPNSPASSVKQWKVAMIMPGKINDVSWNAAGYDGLVKAEKNLGIKFSYSENISVADAETAIRDYASQGYDLILAHSFNYGDAVKKVAKDYPSIKFGWATGIDSKENVTIYDWPAHQAGYLAGMLAASMSKTNKIGATGGFDVPDVVRALEAYKLGAKSVKPDMKIFITYLNEWDDVAKGKEAVLAQIEQGADVVYCNGDGISFGCIQACKEKKIYAIGGIADQNELAPDTVLTSTVLKVDTSIAGMIKDLETGKFKNKYIYDMIEGGVDMAPYHGLENKIPADVRKLLAEKKEAIMKKQFTVPDIIKPEKKS